MTSDEVKARLWEAYERGWLDCNKGHKLNRQLFDVWLTVEMPEVANAEEPYFDKKAESGIPVIDADELEAWEKAMGQDND